MDSSSVSCNSSLLGLPVPALSSVLSSRQIKSSDFLNDMIISQLLKFAKSVIRGYRNAGEVIKEDYAKLLGSILELFSNVRHLCGLDEFEEFILELQSLFMVSNATLSQYCHQFIANFLANLCHMQLAENEDHFPMLQVYKFLLRENGECFSGRQIKSSDVLNDMIISQLLKFAKTVIRGYRNAGEAIKEDYAKLLGSILELFLNVRQLCGLDEFGEFILELQSLFMVSDATMKASRALKDAPGAQTMKSGILRICLWKKKRKLPEGICIGMELLQNGLQVINNALWQDECMEIKNEFFTCISCLQDLNLNST